MKHFEEKNAPEFEGIKHFESVVEEMQEHMPRLYSYTQSTIEVLIDSLRPSQRLGLFRKYCLHCGDKDPQCQCLNHE